jgi:hypothetical protein
MALDPRLAAAQKPHCIVESPTETKICEDDVPDGLALDYSCIVTLDDLSAVGGYRFKPHTGAAGYCAPVYLVSEDGKTQLLSSSNSVCPICYTPVQSTDFEQVGPKVTFELPQSYLSNAPHFTKNVDEFKVQHNRKSTTDDNKLRPCNKRRAPIRNANGKTGTVVIMKGVVGSGKSTAAHAIKSVVEARGGYCLVVGTDRHCKNDVHISNACLEVTKELESVSQCTNDDLVVVIDTCGEHFKNSLLFGINFNGWKFVTVMPNVDKTNMAGYFAWSLRNVLKRVPPGPDDHYSLYPGKAGVDVCIEVHKKKAKALFSQSEFSNWRFSGADVDTLSGLADEYESNLSAFEIPSEI